MKSVVPVAAGPVPGISDEISFPLAKRVAKLSLDRRKKSRDVLIVEL